MFNVKKPAIITVLVFLLVLVGYVNHQLTQNSLLKSSNDYQKHEEKQMAEYLKSNNENYVQTISDTEKKDDKKDEDNEKNDDKIKDTEIKDSKECEISKVTGEVNSDIEETLSKEENLKSNNYFIEYRLSRDKLRAGLIDRLKEIVDNKKTTEEVRTEAQKEMMKIGNMSEKELSIEGLIKAKGFEEALVFLDDESAKVVVSVDEMSDQDVVKILNIVKNETKLDASRIKIMKKF